MQRWDGNRRGRWNGWGGKREQFCLLWRLQHLQNLAPSLRQTLLLLHLLLPPLLLYGSLKELAFSLGFLRSR